jgi:hypothetical protein
LHVAIIRGVVEGRTSLVEDEHREPGQGVEVLQPEDAVIVAIGTRLAQGIG